MSDFEPEGDAGQLFQRSLFDEMDSPVSSSPPAEAPVPMEPLKCPAEPLVMAYFYINNTRPKSILKMYKRRDHTQLRNREWYKSQRKKLRKKYRDNPFFIDGYAYKKNQVVPEQLARVFIDWLEQSGCKRPRKPVGPLLPVIEGQRYGQGFEQYKPYTAPRTTGIGTQVDVAAKSAKAIDGDVDDSDVAASTQPSSNAAEPAHPGLQTQSPEQAPSGNEDNSEAHRQTNEPLETSQQLEVGDRPDSGVESPRADAITEESPGEAVESPKSTTTAADPDMVDIESDASERSLDLTAEADDQTNIEPEAVISHEEEPQIETTIVEETEAGVSDVNGSSDSSEDVEELENEAHTDNATGTQTAQAIEAEKSVEGGSEESSSELTDAASPSSTNRFQEAQSKAEVLGDGASEHKGHKMHSESTDSRGEDSEAEGAINDRANNLTDAVGSMEESIDVNAISDVAEEFSLEGKQHQVEHQQTHTSESDVSSQVEMDAEEVGDTPRKQIQTESQKINASESGASSEVDPDEIEKPSAEIEQTQTQLPEHSSSHSDTSSQTESDVEDIDTQIVGQAEVASENQEITASLPSTQPLSDSEDLSEVESEAQDSQINDVHQNNGPDDRPAKSAQPDKGQIESVDISLPDKPGQESKQPSAATRLDVTPATSTHSQAPTTVSQNFASNSSEARRMDPPAQSSQLPSSAPDTAPFQSQQARGHTSHAPQPSSQSRSLTGSQSDSQHNTTSSSIETPPIVSSATVRVGASSPTPFRAEANNMVLETNKPELDFGIDLDDEMASDENDVEHILADLSSDDADSVLQATKIVAPHSLQAKRSQSVSTTAAPNPQNSNTVSRDEELFVRGSASPIREAERKTADFSPHASLRTKNKDTESLSISEEVPRSDRDTTSSASLGPSIEVPPVATSINDRVPGVIPESVERTPDVSFDSLPIESRKRVVESSSLESSPEPVVERPPKRARVQAHPTPTIASLTSQLSKIKGRSTHAALQRQIFEIAIGAIKKYGPGGHKHPMCREALRQLHRCAPNLPLRGLGDT